MTFKIKYKNGLCNDWSVEADNELEAKKLGLAHYRANAGYVETVDFWPMEKVVASAEIVD